MLFLQLDPKQQAWLDAWHGNAELMTWCLGFLLLMAFVFSMRRIRSYYKDKNQAQLEWERFEEEIAALKAEKKAKQNKHNFTNPNL